MPTTAEKVAAFRCLHRPGAPFIIANSWDAGSARILQGLGAKALATTSSGFALTLGRKDYGVGREEALAHCRLVAGGVDIPVSADLENGFGLLPGDAAATIRAASETGLAGGSIEDSSRDADDPIIDKSLAIERIAARHSIEEFAEAGVARLSLGGALAFGAYGSLCETAQVILRDGSFNALAGNRETTKRIKDWLA